MIYAAGDVLVETREVEPLSAIMPMPCLPWMAMGTVRRVIEVCNKRA